MYGRQKHLDCEYIDDDNRKRHEKVYFIDNLITAENQSYRLNGFVAKGGNSSVFICYDCVDNQKYAVKFLRMLSTARRSRFEFESLVLSDLEHKNILPLKNVGQVETTYKNSIPFIITDFFSTNIERKVKNDGNLSIREVRNYGIQICDAFEYLHDQGIVHRDIKPSNFLIEEDCVVVGDFALAKTLTEEGQERFWRGEMTATDERVGSIPWMSPELFRYAEDKKQKVDHRSDLFQVGCILWYMHTGSCVKIPDKDDDQSQGMLYDIVFKLLQDKPDKRFQTASDLRDTLQRLPED